jgi:hypothetical protein
VLPKLTIPDGEATWLETKELLTVAVQLEPAFTVWDRGAQTKLREVSARREELLEIVVVVDENVELEDDELPVTDVVVPEDAREKNP